MAGFDDYTDSSSYFSSDEPYLTGIGYAMENRLHTKEVLNAGSEMGYTQKLNNTIFTIVILKFIVVVNHLSLVLEGLLVCLLHGVFSSLVYLSLDGLSIAHDRSVVNTFLQVIFLTISAPKC